MTNSHWPRTDGVAGRPDTRLAMVSEGEVDLAMAETVFEEPGRSR